MATVELFKALADGTRLRIVRAVLQAELSVAELVQVLGLPQSTVSRHLKPLREVQLLDARREGTSIFYHVGPACQDALLARFIEEFVQQQPQVAEDRASVARVLVRRKQRTQDFFDRIAGSYGTLTEPGGGWSALATALACGFAGRDVADLGAGEGDLTLLLGRFARTVTAVDASAQMLSHLRSQADAVGMDQGLRLVQCDIEDLQLAANSMDAVFLSQALHHAARPGKAVQEAARVLRAGGLMVILDLARHEQEWVREEWADVWLGFDLEQITSWLAQAGVKPVAEERLPGSTADLTVQLVVGRKLDMA